MRRRHQNKLRTRREREYRKAIRRKSCDPRRLWPLDSVQRQDFEVAHCGEFDRVMKWIYGGRDAFLGRPDPVERMFFETTPFFGLVAKPKAAVLA